MFTEMLERNKENSYPKQWVWLGDWPLFQNRRQNMIPNRER